MSKYLRKFETEAEYSAATIYTPSVSLIASNMSVKFDPYITFSGLTVYYNISDTSQPTQLFYTEGGGSGSGSGSGSGGVLPSSMIIDGTEVEVTDAYAFDTVGEHIVNYSFAENQIPAHFLDGEETEFFSTKVEIGDAITSIGDFAFYYCISLTGVTIGSGVTSIGQIAFNNCTSLTSISSNAITAPTLDDGVFDGVSYNGVLTVPSGSQGYCGWIGGGKLPSYWTIEGVTCE